MFNALGSLPFPTGSLMVPTTAGLLRDPSQDWTQENVIPFDFDTTTENRVPDRRDNFMYSDRSVGIEGWVGHWAGWKTRDFQSWSSSRADGWTAANRPGMQLMDQGLGNLAGTFRNAGFTTGGPCSAWEYGIIPGDLWDSSTYKEMSPAAFGDFLRKSYNILYTYNGHFTEPGNALPLQFKMGGVVVHNHDLTKSDSMYARATYSIIEARADGQYDSYTRWWNQVKERENKFTDIYSPEAIHNTTGANTVSWVGRSFTINNNSGLLGLCQDEGPSQKFGFKFFSWRPAIAKETQHPWVAFIQDQSVDYMVLKIVQNKGPFVYINHADYCFIRASERDSLCALGLVCE